MLGVIAPAATPVLTAPWRLAFETLATATERWRLILATPEGGEAAAFYGDPARSRLGLVSYVASATEVRIAFPVAHRDVLAVIADHLAEADIDAGAPFLESFDLAEWAGVAAFGQCPAPAGAGWGGWTAAELGEAWRRDPDGAQAARALLAPAADPALDPAALVAGLDRLRERALALSIDGERYEPHADLEPLAASLGHPERVVSVEWAVEEASGRVRLIDFSLLLGPRALWLTERQGEGRDARVRVHRVHWPYVARRLARLGGLAQHVVHAGR
jgi:hypothetical protein